MDVALGHMGLPAGVPGVPRRSSVPHVAQADPGCLDEATCQATGDPPIPAVFQSGGPILPSTPVVTTKPVVFQSGGPALPHSGYDVTAIVILALIAVAVGSALTIAGARRPAVMSRIKRRRPDVTVHTAIGAFAIVGLMTACVIGLLSTVASAHAPIISGTTACRPTAASPWTVQWSIRNSETIAERIMTIERSVLLQSPLSWTPPVPGTVAPGTRSSANSTYAAATATATLQIDGLWHYDTTTIRRTEYATVNRPAICPPAATTTSLPGSGVVSSPTTTPSGTTVATQSSLASAGPTSVATTGPTDGGPTSLASAGPTSLLASGSATSVGKAPPTRFASGGPLLPATGGSSRTAPAIGLLTLVVGAAAVALARRRPGPATD